MKATALICVRTSGAAVQFHILSLNHANAMTVYMQDGQDIMFMAPVVLSTSAVQLHILSLNHADVMTVYMQDGQDIMFVAPGVLSTSADAWLVSSGQPVRNLVSCCHCLYEWAKLLSLCSL